MSDNLSENKQKGFKQFLTFICFSLGAGIIEIVSYTIISEIFKKTLITVAVGIAIAEVISVIFSCTFNFTLNRKYTFKSATNVPLGMALYGLYYLIATPLGAFFIVKLTGLGLNQYLAKGIKMLLNFLVDFCYCKFFIFKIGKKKDVNDNKT